MNRLFLDKIQTSNYIFILHTLAHKYKQQKKCRYLCLDDFRKAYDNVCQNALVLKLLRNGINEKMFNSIDAMYDGCTAGQPIRVKCTHYGANLVQQVNKWYWIRILLTLVINT